MSDFGIATWDAAGNYNNYGIKPVSVIQTISLTEGQNTGTYSFANVPAGMKVGFALTLSNGNNVNIARRIVASGNTITITPATDVGGGNYPANAIEMVVFLETA